MEVAGTLLDLLGLPGALIFYHLDFLLVGGSVLRHPLLTVVNLCELFEEPLEYGALVLTVASP